MLTTVRQQMICIIAPEWPGGAELPGSKPIEQALDGLFKDVRVVHFASIALLPAMSPGQLPSLMLELAIEEGISPSDLLVRLVEHPSGAMWSLYSAYWPNGGPDSVSKRNEQLLDRLIGWHHIADGGFVGARDRSVRQIEKERKLLDETRTAARAMRAQHGSDRPTFALAIARWAFKNPDFEWATEPAPRSYWRGKGAGIGAKLAYPSVFVGLWLLVVWLVGALSRWFMRADTWFFGAPHPTVQAVLDSVSETSRYLLSVSGRGLLALATLALLVWVFLFALPALFAAWRRWLESIQRELERPTETWSSLSTYVVGWLVGVPLVLAVIACAALYTFAPKYLAHIIEPWIPQVPGWMLILIGAFAIIVLLCVGALFSWINRRFSKLSEWFFHPHEDDVRQAQQVHPSIERCEAKLVRKTAHMISLTDMRSPHGWSAWWTRAALRIVTLFGRVFFTEGRLGDAPGIHFGHWHVIDNGRRFLFCSNYDGNFGGYLDDFINGATAGTTLAWRWTKLKQRASAANGQPEVPEPRTFPPTRFVAFRGVKCELKFKSYARDSMLPHLYRFDACNATIDEINLATGLRDALFGERNEKNDDLIMRAIES